ncbi:MAG: methionyl-tRNA formyltransferase [Candidatus Levyibacteriota bacterium]
MKIIFFGTPQEVVPVLQTLIKQHNVVAVVTTPDQKSGRKQQLTPPPVKVFAEKQGIPLLQPEQMKTENLKLKIPQSDLIVVAAYGKIIPNEILELPKFGAINIHPSLLPKYRGPTPIQTALLNGDETSGLTFIKMDAQMDHGPILHQLPFTLEKTDTFAWLMQSKFSQAANVLPHVIDEYISGKHTPQPQDETQASYTQRISKEDGFIDLDTPPRFEKLDRMIRAYYPWPTVWTKVRIKNQESRVKFLPSSSHPELAPLPRSRSSRRVSGSNILLQLEGKNPVSLKDFLNGYPEMRGKMEDLFTNK